VTSISEKLNLNAGKGNLALTAATDSVNKTDVSVGLKLGGGVAEQKWTPSSGSGHLAVNVVRNETHTETTLNTDTAKINAGGDAKFIGGSVNANHASGTISGDSHSEQLANKVNEVSVSLAANGSGKLAVPTTDKWAEAAKNDWNNGSIAGVKADVKLEVNAKYQQTATNAGVNATQDTVVVKGVKSRTEMKNHHSRQIHFKAEATTAIKKQVEAKIPEKVRQVVKPIRAVNLQLIKNNKVNYKVRVRH
jgi:hemolysin